MSGQRPSHLDPRTIMEALVNGANYDWRLDRSLTLPAILAIVTGIISAATLGATLKTRIETIEARTAAFDSEMRDARATSLHVARIDARLEALQETMAALRDDMRQLRKGMTGDGR